jgi:glycerol-3-phosphate dehydrogenase
LVTITGGKWTTYRKMGQETVDQAALVAGLEVKPCVTHNMRIHGWLKNVDLDDPMHVYGSDAVSIKRMIEKDSSLGQKLHDKLPYRKAEIIWAVREEMARNVEDVLARRTRALLLDAKCSIETARNVAEIMAVELGKNNKWIENQVEDYTNLAKGYFLI